MTEVIQNLNQIRYIKRRIRELQRDLADLGADKRKEYWRDYYRMNRERKLQAANERNRARREATI